LYLLQGDAFLSSRYDSECNTKYETANDVALNANLHSTKQQTSSDDCASLCTALDITVCGGYTYDSTTESCQLWQSDKQLLKRIKASGKESGIRYSAPDDCDGKLGKLELLTTPRKDPYCILLKRIEANLGQNNIVRNYIFRCHKQIILL